MIKKNFVLILFFFLTVNNILSSQPNVLVFIVDGLQTDAAKTAAENGADNFKYFIENGVTVEEAYCSSPSPYLRLPDGSLPWGTSSPPNVAIHTGTHVFESRQMDDIFLSTKRANIKSVFSGGADNYKEFNTADYCYYSSKSPDSVLVDFALNHFKNDNVRLTRLHIQRLRNHWVGPEGKTDPNSDYQKYLLHVDKLLGKLIAAFKEADVWDSTYVIFSADHGMGETKHSDHPASVASSWKVFMNFYGPRIKKGKTIPYAEAPDMAVMINHFFKLPPLKGHTDTNVTIEPKGPTGTLLTNIFEGQPYKIDHPKFIKRYLESVNWKPSDEFGEYREAMINYIKELRKIDN